MSQIVSIKKMLENGVHFGHQTRRWNPKMKPYIYTSRNGVYIVDLNQTQKQIEDAYNALKKISEDGGKVLFVGTKKQAAETIEEQALRSGSFYVNKRWLGGLLTNFRTIQKRVKRLVEIEEPAQSTPAVAVRPIVDLVDVKHGVPAPESRSILSGVFRSPPYRPNRTAK